MDFAAPLYGSAKFEGEFGILPCHSICLISGVKFAVQHEAVDVVAWDPNEFHDRIKIGARRMDVG